VDSCIDAINAQTKRVNEWMENRTESQKSAGTKMHRIFAVYTDGEDTSSDRYTVKQFHGLSTKIQERDGADFFYLATGQDAIRMGAAMGFRASHTMTTGRRAAPIFRSLANATQRASSGGPPAFTKLERGVSAPAAPLGRSLGGRIPPPPTVGLRAPMPVLARTPLRRANAQGFGGGRGYHPRGGFQSPLPHYNAVMPPTPTTSPISTTSSS